MRTIALALAMLTATGCASVGTGYRGVKLHFSKPTGEVLGEGFYVFNPIAGTSIVAMNVQTVADEVKGAANSKDLQAVTSTVTVNYHLDPGQVESVYDRLRDDYQARIVDPSAHEAIKAAIGHYNASNLIENRDAVRDAIERDLTKRLSPYGIRVDQVLITDFAFNDTFQSAVEEKVAAQQNLLTAKIDAQKAIAQAAGAAAAQRAQRVTLSQLLIEQQAIQKWDGKLPTYVTGGSGFNLMKMLGGSNE